MIGSLTDIAIRKTMEDALSSKGREQQLLIGKLQDARDQLLQSEKMASIGQFAAGIAHEINNPVGFVNSNMGSLKGYVATLFGVLKEYGAAIAAQAPALMPEVAQIRKRADLAFLQQDVTELVKESMDGLKRVKDIVQALKDFSHVGEVDWQIADLHQGRDSTLHIVANEIEYKATVEKHHGRIPPIQCLASQLNQVFMNLLVNAGQAIKDKGRITIRTASENDWVWGSVADSGCGIAREFLNRID